MPVRSNSFLGRMAASTRTRPALVHFTAPPRLARFLVAVGAQRSPTGGASAKAELASSPAEIDELSRQLAIALLDARRQTRIAAQSLVIADTTSRKTMRALYNALAAVLDTTYSLNLANLRAGLAKSADTLEPELQALIVARGSVGMILSERRTAKLENFGSAQITLILQRAERALPPPDLTGVDLRSTEIDREDLQGAIWNNTTSWPDSHVEA
jgi:hypothetical protein